MLTVTWESVWTDFFRIALLSLPVRVARNSPNNKPSGRPVRLSDCALRLIRENQ